MSKYGLAVDKWASLVATKHVSNPPDGKIVLTSLNNIPVLPADRVYRVTALTSPGLPTETVLSIFEATGVSGMALTGVTAAKGYTDVDLNPNVTVQIRICAEAIAEIQEDVETIMGVMNVDNPPDAHFVGNVTISGNLEVDGALTENGISIKPGGLTHDLQWNNNGAFAGSGPTWNGSNAMAITGTLAVSGAITSPVSGDLRGSLPSPIIATINGVPFGTMATQNAASVNITGGNVTGVPIPTHGSDAANKNYVDSVTTQLSGKQSCRLASTVNLGVVYFNGSSGVGATMTNAGASGALVLDTFVVKLNDRVLIKNQLAPSQNGIYTLTVVGTSSVNWVLTRATDYDSPQEVSEGTYSVIEEGAVDAGSLWIETNMGPFTIGTTPIVFTELMVAPVVITLTGDATGTGSGNIAVTVTGLHGAPLGSTTPVAGNLLIGDGTKWVTQALHGGATVGSDGLVTVNVHPGGAAGDLQFNNGTGGFAGGGPTFSGGNILTVSPTNSFLVFNQTTGTNGVAWRMASPGDGNHYFQGTINGWTGANTIWITDASSVHLYGVPTAPTAAHGTNTTQIATTEFALANRSVPGGAIHDLQWNNGSGGFAGGGPSWDGTNLNALGVKTGPGSPGSPSLIAFGVADTTSYITARFASIGNGYGCFLHFSDSYTYNYGIGTGSTGNIEFRAGLSFGSAGTLTASFDESGNATITGVVTATKFVTPNNLTDYSFQAGTMGMQCYAANNCWLSDNLVFNGGAFIYKGDGYGAIFRFANGGFELDTAVHGTAGAGVALVSRIQIDNSGTVDIKGNVYVGDGITDGFIFINSTNTARVLVGTQSVVTRLEAIESSGLGQVGTQSNHPFSVIINGSSVATFSTDGSVAFNDAITAPAITGNVISASGSNGSILISRRDSEVLAYQLVSPAGSLWFNNLVSGHVSLTISSDDTISTYSNLYANGFIQASSFLTSGANAGFTLTNRTNSAQAWSIASVSGDYGVFNLILGAYGFYINAADNSVNLVNTLNITVATGAAQIILNNATSGQQSRIMFYDAGNLQFYMGSNGPNGFFIYDTVSGVTVLNIPHGGVNANITFTGAVVTGKGTTRPTNPVTGAQWYDTSLTPHKPIWWNGAAWTDAMGNVV